MKKIVLLWLLSTQASFADIQQVRGWYFQNLDYNQPHTALKLVFREDELIRLAKKPGASLEETALLRAYAAMFMRNLSDAAYEGRVTYRQLTHLRRFSRHKLTLEAEIAARERYRLALLKLPQSVLQGDGLIEGFYHATFLWRERFEQGAVLESTIDSMIDLMERSRFFNLFSSLIVFYDLSLTAEQDERVFALVSKTVDEMRSGQFIRPARPLDQTPLRFDAVRDASFARPAAVTILGDVYLKRADRLLTDQDPANDGQGIGMAHQSLGLYQSVTAAAWPNAFALDDRIKNTKLLLRTGKSVAGYWAQPSARRVYNCASCHSR